MLRSGDEIGPYTLINKLGKGAFGVVWLAEGRTQITTTTAAVKIPLDEDISIASEYAPDGSLEAYLKKHGKAPTIESAA